MKYLYLLLCICLCILFTNCDKDGNVNPDCSSGEVVLEVSEKTGTLHFNEQRDTHYIRYFIPGTIDSYYIGFVCTNAFPNFAFTEGMAVSFSGVFRETSLYDNNDFEVVIGGQEVYLFELKMLAAE